MTCPAGLEPFRFTSDGVALPLFVPAVMLEESRRQWPKMWVEAAPDVKLAPNQAYGPEHLPGASMSGPSVDGSTRDPGESSQDRQAG